MFNTEIDKGTRDYYFDLLKTASPESKDYILTGLYGMLEGIGYTDPTPLLDLMDRIQRHTDIDHGLR